MALILILIAAALILGLIELFLMPGFGLAGISAIGCAAAAVAFIYVDYGLAAALVAVVVGLVILALMLWWMAHSKALERISLKTSIDSKNATPEQLAVKPGDEGVALTRLALVGNARFGNSVVEVKSNGAFIDPKARIRVVSVSEALITVEQLDPQ